MPPGGCRGRREQAQRGKLREGREIRSVVRAVCGLEYSRVICLDFGVKARNQRSVNSRAEKQPSPAYDEQGCFPSNKQSISVELISSWGFPEC